MWSSSTGSDRNLSQYALDYSRHPTIVSNRRKCNVATWARKQNTAVNLIFQSAHLPRRLIVAAKSRPIHHTSRTLLHSALSPSFKRSTRLVNAPIFARIFASASYCSVTCWWGSNLLHRVTAQLLPSSYCVQLLRVGNYVTRKVLYGECW